MSFLGPDSSAMLGPGTFATEPLAVTMDGTEVCLEQGEQVADVHVLPLGEELQELIQSSLAQSHQFQLDHHTRSQHIASSLDHIAVLAASLEEGNPVPSRLSDLVASPIAGTPSVELVGPSLLASLCREREDVDSLWMSRRRYSVGP